MPHGPTDSHLRVFLSADLVGSTSLKNRLNHQELHEKYRTRLGIVEKLQGIVGNGTLTDLIGQDAVLESLGISLEDIDWAMIVEDFYRGLHGEFAANLKRFKEQQSATDIDDTPTPWKAIGDELIYQFPIRSRRSLHWITIAFLAALRTNDHKMGSRCGGDQGLCIKGAAWIAGFPVRNRIIQLPKVDSPDFIGPDIDAGFRIAGSCTRPGMLVVSVEMAELLGEVSGDLNPIVGKTVGWEDLKGVWNGKKYPVVWIDLPSGFPNASHGLKAQPFDDWQKEECALCRAWDASEPAKRPLREFVEEMRRLRKLLPKSLGLVNPYIVGDRHGEPEVADLIPEEHQRIIDLLTIIQEYQQRVQRQGADEPSQPHQTGGVAGADNLPDDFFDGLLDGVIDDNDD